MAIWAQLDENNFVINTIVGNDQHSDRGYSWIISNLGGRWVETSSDGSIGDIPAGVGSKYCDDHQSFACFLSCDYGDFIRRWKGKEDICEESYFMGRFFSAPIGSYMPQYGDQELVSIIEMVVKNSVTSTILDIGAGIGNIGISLALEMPGSKVVLVEPNSYSAQAARDNAENLAAHAEIEVIEQSLEDVDLSSMNGNIDVIITNNPSMPITEAQDTELEEYSAIYSGIDGLDFVRILLSKSFNLLSPAGYIIFRSVYHPYEYVLENAVDKEKWSLVKLSETFIKATPLPIKSS